MLIKQNLSSFAEFTYINHFDHTLLLKTKRDLHRQMPAKLHAMCHYAEADSNSNLEFFENIIF